MKIIINRFTTGLLKSLLVVMLLGSHATTSAITDMQLKPDNISNHIGQGRWTVIEIWAHDCIMCRQHMPQLVAFNGTMPNVDLLGISVDGPAKQQLAQSFINEFRVNFPTLLSSADEMRAWYQLQVGEPLIGTPTMLILNPAGKVIAAQQGTMTMEEVRTYLLRKMAEYK